jgi:hypothetical protein
MEFNEAAVNEWVTLCNKERMMREEGADPAEQAAMHIRVLKEMVNLLPNLNQDEKMSLFVSLLNQNTPSQSQEQEDPGELNK